MNEFEYSFVQFYRTYSGIATKARTKYHIYFNNVYAEKMTLCKLNFSPGRGVPVAEYLKAIIDEKYMLEPESICKVCYGEFLKNTGRWIEYDIETKTPQQCGCQVRIREMKNKKVARIYFCKEHAAIDIENIVVWKKSIPRRELNQNEEI